MTHFDHPDLESDAVHVWHLDLQLPETQSYLAEDCLSEDERLTAAYFREERHRVRFVAGRVLLRHLLASYSTRAASDLQFQLGANGKPQLVQPVSEPTLHFNFSHSADRAVCALTRVGPVGVDLERVQPWEDLRELELLVFTAREVETLNQLESKERDQGFFRLWTHKEALVKATGEGLSLSPKRFGVDLDDARCIEADFDHDCWRFADVSYSREWPAALAIACDDFRVQQFT